MKTTILAAAFLAGTSLAAYSQDCSPTPSGGLSCPMYVKVWGLKKPVNHAQNCTFVWVTNPEVNGNNSDKVDSTEFIFAIRPANNPPTDVSENDFDRAIWDFQTVQIVSHLAAAWLFATGGAVLCDIGDGRGPRWYNEILPRVEPKTPY